MDAVDSNLQYIFSFFFKSILTYLVTVILVGYNMPWFLVFNMFLVVIYIYYQTFYIVLSRELKRLISISYSPIMSLMSESLNGYSIIDAYDHFERFIYLNYEKIQYNVDFVFNFRSTNRWLSVRLQTIGATIVLATAILALATMNTKRQLSSGMVGLLMSYSLEVTGSLTWIVRTTVMIETNIVSVERIVEYCELPPEAQSINPEKRPDENWPSKGGIEFKNYSTKYRENLDPVLNNINVKIEPCEKVGIVGRTGAGKSTLSLALFRILEATEGKIIIDGIDISDIGLFDLRSHLAIIPQDAQAFEGTVKTNLDPFNRYSEDELKRAVEQAHLKPHLEKMLHSKPRGDDSNEEDGNVNDILDVKINENGSNLSVGQRQLLCLARALLNRSKILVLDEATASVDMETDKIIQDTIRREFKDRTILTIAHRIDTVLDSDKIIVLDQGSVREFDSPSKLLSDKTSIFYSLCEKGGYLK
ncbi:CLL_collapsed_G0035170.mRNA.1.CDS.1 [Saccharomyces cerevisiae]|uniref:K7_Bpt1bp n=1 Tax=Saccharomyces cerevisiae (strain Kyokai no. 7 / NBRC 101557) TaxID=721032 RepID=G2WII0_YEASK|nr:K7_Bpt1bp [Saccharomyces cerevisiae Kyokai no. 7]CAI5287307.1 CLL_HP2_G0030240.mRNA.1.CDS.1 [Saccharomyces cerevisiae]CAI6577670.1 CLL_HP2_G0030240.mRNA.1.CDS.1 [Saccharomyces cerevisiae]CAI6683421.1 CLL_HP1_G0034750.mRNA.1.CDS.1 [Saccharomyces cerevisiae]CAI7401953.1 CLL_collapsed_G0035170.mRNA.1.CDS.1 [Saccharomyces cerevisiae]